MPAAIVVGCQYGDEGKGKAVDYLAENADMVVRFGGGNNAGHTVVNGEEEYKLHLIPSGILHEGVKCVIGNGVVINLEEMIQEIDGLEERGISTENLFISNRAHLILPFHLQRDQKSEESRENKIGTTGKGIGPAYKDKIGRVGIRVGDLSLNISELRNLITQNCKAYGSCYVEEYDLSAKLKEYWTRLRKHIIDSSSIVNEAIHANKRVLFEGAQGLLIDVDHGTYPYVTSSNPSAGGVCTGVGVGPTKIKHTMGVVKAYTTRVGEGPFPTELYSNDGDLLRLKGNEFGTTTGRPRRCGWIDIVSLKYAVSVNGLDSIAFTKLDILDGMDELKICIAYEIDGKVSDNFPSTSYELNRVKPIYKTFPGWSSPISGLIEWTHLPIEARNYIGYITSALKTPILMVGTGPGRNKIIGGKKFWESF